MADNKMFDENGTVITDPKFDGESRTFEELEDSERDTYIQTQKNESTKLDSIITRKGDKVKTLNEALKDDEVELGENGEPKLDEQGNTIPKQVDKENKDDKGDELNSSKESERMDRMELRQDGYAPEVIDEIMKLGGKSALDNPILKKSADELQEAHVAEKAANDLDGGPNSVGETKLTNDDLKEMSSEEMEKVLPHANQ